MPEIDGHGFIWHHITSFEFMVSCFPIHRCEGRKHIRVVVVVVTITGFSYRQPFLLIISLGRKSMLCSSKDSLYQGLILHLEKKTLELFSSLLNNCYETFCI